jgi:hypothetical protein
MSKESQIVRTLLERWTKEADPALQPMWDRVIYNIWQRKDNNVMVTLQWTPLQLDIATFIMPDDANPESADPTTDQMLVFNKPGRYPIFLPQNKNKVGELVTVPEVVDAFLDRAWTPHWMCHTCRKRMTQKIFPE